jgi:hypothetical protein
VSEPFLHKLQINLAAIQYWFKKWRIIKANRSKSTSHPPHEEKCALLTVQLSQEENVKNLRLHLDRRLTWHKDSFAKWKQLGLALTKMQCLLGCKSSTRNKLLI